MSQKVIDHLLPYCGLFYSFQNEEVQEFKHGPFKYKQKSCTSWFAKPCKGAQ